MQQTPFEQIVKSASAFLPANAVRYLPDKWEKIGSVVSIKLPYQVRRYQEVIGKVYAEILGCETALNDVGGIEGVYRKPIVEIIYGSPITETIHIENKIRFQLDPQRIMFSSGNMGERKRMATIANPKETVVDLFAGIGYFSIPMAVYSKPVKIFACEVNPIAYRYLCENIILNKVIDKVEPLFGDNRLTAPKECAHRVILGYFEEPKTFLPTALEALKNQTGVVHYHDVVPVEEDSQESLKDIERVAEKYHRSIELLKLNRIKSYAPWNDHVVFDVRIVE